MIFLLAAFSQSFDTYYSYLDQLDQPAGNYQKGEIEIVLEPEEIEKVARVQENRLLRKGFTSEEAADASKIGIVAEDPYWIWIRDAVYFPRQIPGTYDRLIWKSQLKNGTAGIAVLPILPSGEIALNLNYRHATRSWELELPRGGTQPNETLEEAAIREIREETGLIPSSLQFLGEMTPDSGALSSVVPIFLGKIMAQESANPEESEAIAGLVAFSKEQIKKALLDGFLELEIEGETKAVPIRDSFLTFALLQAQLRGLW